MRTEMTTARKTLPTPVAQADISYEDALAELERLVSSMEGGQLPLDRLIHSYQRGAELLQVCRARLEAVEGQVKVLEEGRLKPWAAS
jgi:exodeoxyribonuclease VII small subunit